MGCSTSSSRAGGQACEAKVAMTLLSRGSLGVKANDVEIEEVGTPSTQLDEGELSASTLDDDGDHYQDELGHLQPLRFGQLAVEVAASASEVMAAASEPRPRLSGGTPRRATISDAPPLVREISALSSASEEGCSKESRGTGRRRMSAARRAQMQALAQEEGPNGLSFGLLACCVAVGSEAFEYGTEVRIRRHDVLSSGFPTY
mmetsp:Transcript_13146/g.32931  ORF Transcript_13146/g.32931 Transcript_13146/m.32931 type:complete len:203 (+) Transcript_13146:73-681(+)|eukprot:CAMPEP_0183399290 /NCGR_PEP_ID=MMETSP0370-20130417/11837_1 /TAXON_ID=268820 /ORGANISM="Peridinium aciculiferum, Strain PAER-2" /LENGTH=202 /DNA_ID=CAMNT_0025580421 /DNA_START=71 /DNA_END=679 /DNA_ORIENTATION=+